METKGYARHRGDGVQEIDSVTQQSTGIDTGIGEVLAAALWVAQHPKFGRINLNIFAAERGEFLRFLPYDFGRISEQLEGVGVNVARILRRPSKRHHQRTGQSDLEGFACTGTHVSEFLAGQGTKTADLLDYCALNLDFGLFGGLVK